MTTERLWGLVWDIFDFHPCFTPRHRIRARSDIDKESETGGRETICGQLMQLECMGICVLIPMYECETYGSLVSLLVVNYRGLRFGLNLDTAHYSGWC